MTDLPSLLQSPAGSTGRCNTGLQFTRRRFKAQGLSRALIQAQSDLVEIGLRVDGQVDLLREVRFNTWTEKNRSAASRCVTMFGASFHRVNMAA
jgi:hypothetical protein